MKKEAEKLTALDQARIVSFMGKKKFNQEVKREILSGAENAHELVVRKKLTETHGR